MSASRDRLPHKALRVVHVGPDMNAHGGIADVLRTYRGSALASDYDLHFAVTTSARGSGVGRLLGDGLGVVSACVAAVPGRPLVHVHTSSGASFTRKQLVARCAMLLGRPVVLHVHSGRFDQFAGRDERTRAAVRGFLERCAAVVAVSETWATVFSEWAPEARVEVVPNPVAVPDTAADHEHRAGILFAGAVRPEKGVGILLAAMAALQERGITVPLVLAGDGERATWTEELGKLPDPSKVTFAGWLDGDTLAVAMNQAAVFCLPSFGEGVPLALLQALANGMSCVATPVGGVADVVEDGVTGRLVPVGDAGALADVLAELLGDPGERQRLSEAARAKVARTHAVDAVVRRLESLYASIGYPPAEDE